MKAGMEFDMREFTSAMKSIQKATGKDGAEILNRAGRNIAFKAIKYTFKTTVAEITKKLGTPAKPTGLAYGITSKALGRKATKEEVGRMIKRRRSAIGYLKAGWVQAAKDFGGNPRVRYSGKGEAREGRGVKARATKLLAELSNTAPAIELYGKPGFEKAVEETIIDMVEHATQRLQRTFNKYT